MRRVGEHEVEKHGHRPLADIVVVDRAEVRVCLLRFGPLGHGPNLRMQSHGGHYLRGQGLLLLADRTLDPGTQTPSDGPSSVWPLASTLGIPHPRKGPAMKAIAVSRDIAAPPDVVWAICTEMDGWVDTIEGIDAVERLDDGQGFGVGTRWRETRKMFGKSATEDMEIIEVDEGTSYHTLAESHGARYQTDVSLEPVGGGSTRLTMTFAGEPLTTAAKIMSTLLGWMGARATRKMVEADLDDIASVAESRP